MTDTTETETGTGGPEPEQEEGAAEAGPGGNAGAEPAGEEYDALRRYEPEREFASIEQARAEIDNRLLEHTRPFAEGVIFLVRLSTLGVVWAAGMVPMLEAARWAGFTPPPVWHAVLILAAPIVVLLTVAAWLFIRMPIKLKWAAVYIEMFLDDEVSNLLINERDASRGELKGIHIGSNAALLRLLRLRMKAFHFWHRISIHAFILNGAFFRPALETPLTAPRFWVHAIPLLTLAIFLAVQWGLVIGDGTPVAGPGGLAASWGDRVWNTLAGLQLGGDPNGVPALPFMAAGFALAYLAYWLSRRARNRVVDTLTGFLDTEDFLTPWTHDCSREILLKHEKLIHILARILARRNGHGDPSHGEVGSLILEEGLEDRGQRDRD